MKGFIGRSARDLLIKIVITLVIISPLFFYPSVSWGSPLSQSAHINEFHYDNQGADVDEFVEVWLPLSWKNLDWSLAFYNGSNAGSYRDIQSSDSEWMWQWHTNEGFGLAWINTTGIQNGGRDGFALIAHDNSVTDFVSYEGSLTAISGSAATYQSFDVGVEEGSHTEVGLSLQRTHLQSTGGFGGGSPWRIATASAGKLNFNQAISSTLQVSEPPSQFILICGLLLLFVYRHRSRNNQALTSSYH